MFRFAAPIVAKLFRFCQTLFPSNIVIRRFRRRDGLKWGVPVGLAGTAFYYGLFLLLSTGDREWGWHPWAPLVGIPVVLSVVKFTFLGPISLILLAGHRIREGRLVRRVARELRDQATATGKPTPRISTVQRRELHEWARGRSS